MAAVDRINGGLPKDISRSVLWLNLMWLTDLLNQANHIGENQTHHLRIILELQRQRLHTLRQHGPALQMIRRLHIKAKSLNIFRRNGQLRSEIIREAAAAEAAEADKDGDGQVNKGDSKQAKPKPKQATYGSKKKDKDS